MTERIFPYRTISGDLRLDIKKIWVDDTDASPEPIDRDARELNLFHQENSAWRTLSIKAELQGPFEELRQMPNSDQVNAVVVVGCESTHQRCAVPMRRAGAELGRWNATFELARHNFRGTAKLEAVITGMAGDLPN